MRSSSFDVVTLPDEPEESDELDEPDELGDE